GPDAADEIKRGVELLRQVDRDLSLPDAEIVVVHDLVLCRRVRASLARRAEAAKPLSAARGVLPTPILQSGVKRIKISLCVAAGFAVRPKVRTLPTDANLGPPFVRSAQRRAQGCRRGHPAADSGAGGGGRADGVRAHHHPAPIAAADFAAPAAAGGGRPGRALS